MKKLTILALFLGFFGAFQAKAAVFDNDLYFGLQGNADVSKLQEFLTAQGNYSGPVSGNFFSLTLAGVKAFQTAQGISPAAGYFGPLTRAKANGLVGADVSASNNQAVSETGSAPAPAPSSTVEQQLDALLKQVGLLQQQLAEQKKTNDEILALQNQIQSQNSAIQNQSQALGAIQQNTTPPPPPVAPSPLPTGVDLVVGTSPLGQTVGKTLSNNDDLALINITAGSSDILIKNITINFTGSATQMPSFSGSKIYLYDADNGTQYNPVSVNGLSATYNLMTYDVSPGKTKGFRVRIDAQTLFSGASSADNTLSLVASVNQQSDFTYSKGYDLTTGSPNSKVYTLASAPFQLASVSWNLPVLPQATTTATQ